MLRQNYPRFLIENRHGEVTKERQPNNTGASFSFADCWHWLSGLYFSASSSLGLFILYVGCMIDLFITNMGYTGLVTYLFLYRVISLWRLMFKMIYTARVTLIVIYIQ